MVKEDKSFWLTNISKSNVSIADLNLTIKARSSVNLLDNKHYSYTLEQLQKSVDSGSVYSKRSKIKKRIVAPEIIKMNVPFLRETYIPSRERSVFTIKEEKYEELSVTDEQFAEENIEIVELDNVPIKSKDKNEPKKTIKYT